MAFPRVSCMCVYVCMCAERTVQYVLSSMVLSSSTDWPRTAPRPKYESHVDEAAAPSGLRSLGDATETPEHAQIDRRVQVTHISRILLLFGRRAATFFSYNRVSAFCAASRAPFFTSAVAGFDVERTSAALIRRGLFSPYPRARLLVTSKTSTSTPRSGSC